MSAAEAACSANSLANRCCAECAKAQLKHYRVIENCRSRSVAVICDVIHTQDKAIVDIADTNRVRRKFAFLYIKQGRALQDPVGIEFERCGTDDALSAVQEAELGLRGIVAIEEHDAPA